MKYLLLVVALVASTQSHSNIYDTAFGYNTGFTQSCMRNDLPMAQYISNEMDANIASVTASNNSTFRRINPVKGAVTISTSGQSCYGNATLSFDWERYYSSTNPPRWSDNNPSKFHVNYTNIQGTLQSALSCPPDGGDITFNILGVKTDGTPQCFSNLTLSDVDSCDINQPLLPPDNAGQTTVCVSKPDNSMCVYTQAESNGQTFLEPSLEPSSCYDGNVEPYTEPNTNPPTGQDCQDIGNGTVACPENPVNVCSTDAQGLQTCQSGCGTVSFGGTESFVCLSNDTDGDGIGDYADPDIDGDGIPNDDDLDADGDGNDDPDYGGDTGNGQDTPVNVNVDIDEQAIIDGIVNGLTEQVDLDTTQSENNIDNKQNAEESAIDSILESDSIDFNATIEESGIDDTFDTLKNTLAPSECAAAFTIPFTSANLDMCEAANKAKPFLYVIFAIGTFIYIYRRVMDTARSPA